MSRKYFEYLRYCGRVFIRTAIAHREDIYLGTLILSLIAFVVLGLCTLLYANYMREIADSLEMKQAYADVSYMNTWYNLHLIPAFIFVAGIVGYVLFVIFQIIRDAYYQHIDNYNFYKEHGKGKKEWMKENNLPPEVNGTELLVLQASTDDNSTYDHNDIGADTEEEILAKRAKAKRGEN